MANVNTWKSATLGISGSWCRTQALELSNQRIRKLEYSFIHQFLICFVWGHLEEKDFRQLEVSVTKMVRTWDRLVGWEYQRYSSALTDLETRQTGRNIQWCLHITHVNLNFLLNIVVVPSLSRVPLFATPWTTACQASLSITISLSFLKLMSIESVMPSNHLILFTPFSSCPQSFSGSGSFQINQFTSGG